MSSPPARRGRIRLSNSTNSTSSAFVEPWRRSLQNLLSVRRLQDLSKVLLKSYSIHPDLPIRIRPLMASLTGLCLIVLAILGFHPTLAEKVSPPIPFSDKLLHFVCFAFASSLFYAIWNVDPLVRRVWHWRYFNEIISITVCGIWGSIGSEIVQSLLPYKTFQYGDVIANILGTSLGIFIARSWTKSRRRAQELRRLYQPLQTDGDEGEIDDDDEDEVEQDEAREGDRLERGEMMTEGIFGAKRGRSESNPWDDREDTSSIFGVGGDEDEQEDEEEEAQRNVHNTA